MTKGLLTVASVTMMLLNLINKKRELACYTSGQNQRQIQRFLLSKSLLLRTMSDNIYFILTKF